MRERPERALLKGAEAQEGPREVIFAVEDGEDFLAARLSVRAGWKLLRQEPSLALWVVLGELLGGALKLGPPLALLLGWATLTGGYALEAPEDLLAWASGTVAWLLDPRTVLGGVGMFVVVWAASWVLGVFVQSGVLGALRRRLLAGAWIGQGLFWRSLGERLWSLLGWELARAAVLGGASAVLVGLLWGMSRQLVARAPEGYWLVEGRWEAAALLGAAFALGSGVVALALVVTQLALGPLVLGGKGLWESFGEAALALARRPGEVLGLYAALGLLYGVVWSVYVPFYLVSGEMSADPRLALGGLLLRVALDGALLVALAVVGVWSRAATLSWVALREGVMRKMPASGPAVAAPAEEAPSAVKVEAGAVSFAALRRATRGERK